MNQVDQEELFEAVEEVFAKFGQPTIRQVDLDRKVSIIERSTVRNANGRAEWFRRARANTYRWQALLYAQMALRGDERIDFDRISNTIHVYLMAANALELSAVQH